MLSDQHIHIESVFGHPLKKMWQFSKRKDNGRHSFSLWTMRSRASSAPIPHICLSVGYWASFICVWVSHNLLQDKRNRLHTFFLRKTGNKESALNLLSMKFKILGISDWTNQTMPRRAEIQSMSSEFKCWVLLLPHIDGMVKAIGVTEEGKSTGAENLFANDGLPLEKWSEGTMITTVYNLF